MERTIHLHSLALRIHSDAFALDDLLDRLYGDHALEGAPTSTLELRLGVLDGEPSTPEGTFAETNLCGGRCYWNGSEFVAVVRGEYPLWIAYDLARGVLEARLGEAFLKNPQAILGRVLRAVLQSFVMPFHGLTPVHAALVVRNDRGVLLAGAGGSGKTTTAISLGLSGFTLMSDDGPLLARQDGRVLGFSSLDFVHASVGTLTLFDQLKPHVVGGLDHRNKYAVTFDPFGAPEARHAPVPVVAYVELRRTPGAALALRPLDRSAVLRDLVTERMVVFRKAPLRTPVFTKYTADLLALLAALVSQVQPYRLEFDDHHLADLPAVLASVTA